MILAAYKAQGLFLQYRSDPDSRPTGATGSSAFNSSTDAPEPIPEEGSMSNTSSMTGDSYIHAFFLWIISILGKTLPDIQIYKYWKCPGSGENSRTSARSSTCSTQL